MTDLNTSIRELLLKVTTGNIDEDKINKICGEIGLLVARIKNMSSEYVNTEVTNYVVELFNGEESAVTQARVAFSDMIKGFAAPAPAAAAQGNEGPLQLGVSGIAQPITGESPISGEPLFKLAGEAVAPVAPVDADIADHIAAQGKARAEAAAEEEAAATKVESADATKVESADATKVDANAPAAAADAKVDAVDGTSSSSAEEQTQSEESADAPKIDASDVLSYFKAGKITFDKAFDILRNSSNGELIKGLYQEDTNMVMSKVTDGALSTADAMKHAAKYGNNPFLKDLVGSYMADAKANAASHSSGNTVNSSPTPAAPSVAPVAPVKALLFSSYDAALKLVLALNEGSCLGLSKAAVLGEYNSNAQSHAFLDRAVIALDEDITHPSGALGNMVNAHCH